MLRNKTLHVLLVINCIVIYKSIISFITLIRNNWYDWDIDHEMYFGGRLLSSELLYVVEYHDKLPFVQFIFAAPAAFKNTEIWLAINTTITLIGAIVVYATIMGLVRILKITSYRNENAQLAILAAVLYLYLMIVMPGSLYHINSVAISLFAIGVFINLKIIEQITTLSAYRVMLLANIGAIVVACAISVRPYLGGATLLYCVLIYVIAAKKLSTALSWYYAVSSEFSTKKIAMASIVPMCVGYALLINIGPYFFRGEMSYIFEAWMLLRIGVNPQNIQQLLLSESALMKTLTMDTQGVFIIGNIAPIVILVLLVILRQIGVVHEKHGMSNISIILYMSLFCGLITNVSIEAMFVAKHFWPHYSQMFVYANAVGLGLISIYITNALYNVLDKHQINIKDKRTIDPTKTRTGAISYSTRIINNKGMRQIAKEHIVVCGSIVIVSLATIDVKNVSSIVSSVITLNARQHPLDEVTLKLADWQSSQKLTGSESSFLYIDHMYPHWKLNESRHGFPHAAHFSHINDGWYLKVPVGLLDDIMPKNSENLCKKLINTGPKLLIAEKYTNTIQCLLSNTRFYVPTDPKVAGWGKSLIILTRT